MWGWQLLSNAFSITSNFSKPTTTTTFCQTFGCNNSLFTSDFYIQMPNFYSCTFSDDIFTYKHGSFWYTWKLEIDKPRGGKIILKIWHRFWDCVPSLCIQMIICRKGPLSEVPWTPRFCALKKDFSNPDCIDYCSKVNLETLHQRLQNINYNKLHVTNY